MIIDISTISNEALLFVLAMLIFGMVVAGLVYNISMLSVSPNESKIPALFISFLVFITFFLLATVVVNLDNEKTTMETQAHDDFQNHCVDLDLYFENNVYKNVIDKELEKERVYNSSLSLVDFCKECDKE